MASSVVQTEGSPALPIYTRILPVDPEQMGTITFSQPNNFLSSWSFIPSASDSGANLLAAADALQTSLYPVAFPTETVYGLGANAFSSAAVKGIYAAKQRPSDNPLILHISSLKMLRRILDPQDVHAAAGTECIPSIYKDLISTFWPGPLSILLPLPADSKLAPEVTAGQPTFAARMPSNKLALALIQLSQLPLAAPSANASTRPSPTTAQHVAHDLGGRIELILDGGPCTVGVESTVVDGLCSPPAILRPGGISIDQIRQIPGWKDVTIAYKDTVSNTSSAPRAPGMKYKHYSPTAAVILAEAGTSWDTIWQRITHDTNSPAKIGILQTRTWPDVSSLAGASAAEDSRYFSGSSTIHVVDSRKLHVFSIALGKTTQDIARGLFAALRELDLLGVEKIYVEGIADDYEYTHEAGDGDRASAAAVMNRLRKAAFEVVSP